MISVLPLITRREISISLHPSIKERFATPGYRARLRAARASCTEPSVNLYRSIAPAAAITAV